MNITEQLGLKLPVFQAPFEYYPQQSSLVAKISENGGLGVYSANYQSLSAITESLADIQLRTDASFGVLVDVRQNDYDIDLADKSDANVYLRSAYQALNIEAQTHDPLPTLSEIIEVFIHHHVSVVIFQNGLPDDDTIRICQNANMMTCAIASNVLEAIAIEKSPIDVVILQGLESAGLQSQFDNDIETKTYPINTLLYQALPYVSKPIVAWGDCQTSTHIVAALVNGASAVMIDMPFWTTSESSMPNSYRERLATHNEMQVVMSRVWQGYPSQVLQNELTEKIEATSRNALSPQKQQRLMLPVIEAAIEQDNADFMPLWAGLCAQTSQKTVSELCDKYLTELSDMID